MKRREFIATAGGAVVSSLSWPLAARAQRPARIGVLLIAGPELLGPFREALRDFGYVDGKTIDIDMRSAEGQANRLPELAAALVRANVDIIVASQVPPIIAAKKATREIPIVMAPGGEPVEFGFIASLARPGGNVTGVATLSAELSGKSLELIHEIAPKTRRVSVLGDAKNPFVKPFLEFIQKGALTTGIEIKPTIIHGPDELEVAFAALEGERVEAVVIQPSLPIALSSNLALRYRLPAFGSSKNAVHAGYLAAYSVSFTERARQIAGYVDSILKGAKAADLPVQMATKFELVINLKTAKALGVDIPPMMLARADELIE